MVAAKVGCGLEVAEKILVHGPDAPRNRVHKERAHALFAQRQPQSEPPPPPSQAA